MAEAYKKQTHREHILSLPDTYVGSIETAPEEMFVVDNDKFVCKSVSSFNPGFYKLFDEIVVNAHDHVIRTRQRNLAPVKNIHIEIASDNTWIQVENDGEGIDIVEHPEYKCWVPQLIFGELLTSTNYDKGEKKLVGGKNGYGVKLANIYGKELTVETVDGTRGKKYVQTWKDNMTDVGKPKVTAVKGKPYVRITWTPDFARFGMKDQIPSDIIEVLRRRATDLAMTVGKDVKVHWKHGEESTIIKCKDLGAYASEYVTTPVVYAQINERWNVAVADTPVDKFFNVSFVNGIWTSKGGTHVDYITNQVVNHIVEYLETKKKVKVKPSLVKENLAIFITSQIENPSFNSQTKETLTTKSSAYGSTCKLPEDFLKKIQTKLELVDSLILAQKEKDEKDNKKSDGRKQTKIYGIPKLEDAALAGTAKSSQCTLILTEGDSAKSMALSGLHKVQRQTFGVFPLRGKIMNVKDSSASKVELAKEIAELKKIIGLESGKKYENVSSLRYGSIMIMTDQDYDGSHIRGLLINLFHELWHDLLQIKGFITFMATPIVKAVKGKTVKTFYTQFEYNEWKESAGKGWNIQYYKGLGTSTRDEAQEYFKDMNVVQFKYDENSDSAIDLAFNKSRADDRKTWLQGHNPSSIVKPGKELPYDEFINRDLIHFSHYNLERSIPSVMDGLKTSQRKILFSALKRNLVTGIKVAQLAGYVSEHSGYHHGEASLNETIIGMAQTFVGSNNISWFHPKGQFGTRLEGGSDSAAPRYIFTHLQPYIKHLVPSDDLAILSYRDDDGLSVEPEWYAPILPMLLVNGARGIGTGYSTFVPSYNPDTIKDTLLKWLSSEDKDLNILKNVKLVPWTRGFTGKVEDIGKGDFHVTANYSCVGKNIIVRDLPIGTWTSNFKQTLDALCEKKEIVKDYVDTSTDTDVHFEITLIDALSVDKLEKTLGLSEKIKTTNMHAFDVNGHIKKYATPNDMLVEFAEKRLELYQTRKDYLLKELKDKMPYHDNLVEFIRMVCDEEIDLKYKTEKECDCILDDAGFDRIDETFDYLMRLPLRSLTKENITKHENDLRVLKEKINTITNTNIDKMWIDDLKSFSI